MKKLYNSPQTEAFPMVAAISIMKTSLDLLPDMAPARRGKSDGNAPVF